MNNITAIPKSTDNCLNPSLTDSISNNPYFACYLLVGFCIPLIIIAIIIIFKHNKAKRKINPIENYVIHKKVPFIYPEYCEKQLTIGQCWIRKEIENAINQLNVNDSEEIDMLINDIHKNLSQISFGNWLNRIVENYPNLKNLTENFKEGVFQRVNKITAKYSNNYKINIRPILEKINLTNKKNLEYLCQRQNDEENNIFQNGFYSDNEERRQLKILHQQQFKDLIYKLQINKDLEIETERMKLENSMKKEINSLYFSEIKEFFKHKIDNEIPESNLNEFWAIYVNWDWKLKSLKESVIINEAIRSKYIRQNRENIMMLKENEMKLESKLLNHYETMFPEIINDLLEEGTFDQSIREKLLKKFNQYKDEELIKMNKIKEDKINNLLLELDDSRKQILDDLMNKFNKNIRKLFNDHKDDTEMNILIEKLKVEEEKYYENRITETFNRDNDDIKKLLKICESLSEEYENKLLRKIPDLIDNFKLDAKISQIIYQGINGKISQLKEENKNRVKKLLQKNEINMENIIKKIGDEILKSEIANQYNHKNNIFSEIKTDGKSKDEKLELVEKYTNYHLDNEESVKLCNLNNYNLLSKSKKKNIDIDFSNEVFFERHIKVTKADENFVVSIREEELSNEEETKQEYPPLSETAEEQPINIIERAKEQKNNINLKNSKMIKKMEKALRKKLNQFMKTK